MGPRDVTLIPDICLCQDNDYLACYKALWQQGEVRSGQRLRLRHRALLALSQHQRLGHSVGAMCRKSDLAKAMTSALRVAGMAR